MAVARTLVDAANAGGGGDNITVLALTLGPATSAASEPS
jgi:serine/threonine protein phosphatase PrpC